ncbi:FUSC family protein [Photobacterium japonica]|uniref:FUSC family protein n=1 Tax=Photobacterium japonica TaxID=2910235 RepID=UPI003D107D9B
MISQRARLPLKVATALCLAIVTALWLGWERPYWAAFAVIVMAATETAGHSLRKGRHRLLGTLFGVVMAIVLAGLFPQQPLLLLLSYTVFAAFCVYHQTHPHHGYVWSISLMVCSLILVMGKLQPDLTFSVAVLRMQETVLGVLSFTLVFSVLWPASSRRVLYPTLTQYFTEQHQLLGRAITTLAEQGTLLSPSALSESMKRLTRLDDLLQAADADSYLIHAKRADWQALLTHLNEWAMLCGHLADTLPLLPTLEPHTGTYQLSAQFLMRSQQRAAWAQALLAHASDPTHTYVGESPLNTLAALDSTEQDSTPYPSACDTKTHSLQHHAALMQLARLLAKMDVLHGKIVATLQQALDDTALTPRQRHVSSTSSASHAFVQKKTRWNLNPENAIHALKISVIIGICTALWIAVPMPGGPMVLLLGAILGSVILSLPFANARSLLITMVGWSVIMLAQYVFIMPLFFEIWQLAAFYFVNTFAIWYIFAQPQQLLMRLLGAQHLVLMTNGAMQLTPRFDIQQALLQLLLIGVSMFVIFLVNHGLFSGQAEHVFIRQLRYFRTGLNARLQRLAKGKAQPLCFRTPVPLRSVAQAEMAFSRINLATYPDVDAAPIHTMLAQAYRVCLHYRAFEDSYRAWLAQPEQHNAASQAINGIIQDTLQMLATGLSSPAAPTHHLLPDSTQQRLKALTRRLSRCTPDDMLLLSLTPEQAEADFLLLIALQQWIDACQSLYDQQNACRLTVLKQTPFAL